MSASRQRTHSRGERAFTLAEVAVAATVLLFGLASALAVMQRGMQAMDTARNLGQASQVLQQEMERLRLYNWAQLVALQNSGQAAVATDPATAGRFTCTRVITDLRPGMKQITLTAGWTGYDGRPHTARLITRYGQDGLSDYISTAH